jgi:flagellin-like protein
MKKLLKNKNALSPVVAAIILIAVTVAVAITVAGWMGSLTIGFMETSELTITDLEFTIGNQTDGRIIAHVMNSGTSRFTVDRIRVNGEIISDWLPEESTLDPGNSKIFTITHSVVAGREYAVTLYKMDGTMVGAYISTA